VSNRRVLAFTGPKGCGKTTAAEILVEYSWTLCSFAEPLKKCLKDLFQFSDEQLYTLAGKEAVDIRYGVSPRRVMQVFGTEFVRNVVPDLWVILMQENLIKYTGNITIDDVRFEDEAALVRSFGGIVVHIVGRGTYSKDHKSEAGVQIKEGDFCLQNTGTKTELKAEISEILLKI
jgi:hypothetical protein